MATNYLLTKSEFRKLLLKNKTLSRIYVCSNKKILPTRFQKELVDFTDDYIYYPFATKWDYIFLENIGQLEPHMEYIQKALCESSKAVYAILPLMKIIPKAEYLANYTFWKPEQIVLNPKERNAGFKWNIEKPSKYSKIDFLPYI